MRVTLIAEFTALSGHESEVRELITRLTKDVRAEPGNLMFEAFTTEDRPRHYVVIEKYVDQAAFEAHLEAPYGALFNSKLVPLIEETGSVLTLLVGVD